MKISYNNKNQIKLACSLIILLLTVPTVFGAQADSVSAVISPLQINAGRVVTISYTLTVGDTGIGAGTLDFVRIDNGFDGNEVSLIECTIDGSQRATVHNTDPLSSWTYPAYPLVYWQMNNDSLYVMADVSSVTDYMELQFITEASEATGSYDFYCEYTDESGAAFTSCRWESITVEVLPASPHYLKIVDVNTIEVNFTTLYSAVSEDLYSAAYDVYDNFHSMWANSDWIDFPEDAGGFVPEQGSQTSFTAEIAGETTITVNDNSGYNLLPDYHTFEILANTTVSNIAIFMEADTSEIPTTITAGTQLDLLVLGFDSNGNMVSPDLLNTTQWTAINSLPIIWLTPQQGGTVSFRCETEFSGGGIRATLAGVTPVNTLFEVEHDIPASFVILGGPTQDTTMTAGGTIDLLVAVEDQYGNPIPEAIAHWETTGDPIGTLDPAFSDASTFSAQTVGTGQIQATVENLVPVTTAVITVAINPTAGSMVILHNDTPLLYTTITTDSLLNLSVYGEDNYGNPYSSQYLNNNVEWTFTNLFPNESGTYYSISWSPDQTSANGNISAGFSMQEPASVNFTVEHGAAASIYVENETGQQISSLTMTADEDALLYVYGMDSCDVVFSDFDGMWDIDPDYLGDIDPEVSSVVTFAANGAGEGTLTITAEGISLEIPVTVNPGVEHHADIYPESTPGEPVNFIHLTSGDLTELNFLVFDEDDNHIQNPSYTSMTWADNPLGYFAPPDEPTTSFTAGTAGSGDISAEMNVTGIGPISAMVDDVIVDPAYGNAATLQIQRSPESLTGIVGDTTIYSGSNVLFYAVGYDPAGNWLGPVEADWVMETGNLQGQFQPLLPASQTEMLTYVPTLISSGTLRATAIGGNGTDTTGWITVEAGLELEHLSILESADPSSDLLTADLLCGQTIDLYLHGWDLNLNPYTSGLSVLNVTSTLYEGTFEGVYTPVEAAENYLHYTFTPDLPGNGRLAITYDDGSGPVTGYSGDISVAPGEIAEVAISVNGDTSMQSFSATTDDVLNFGYIAKDADENIIPPELVVERYVVVWDTLTGLPDGGYVWDSITDFFTFSACTTAESCTLTISIEGITDQIIISFDHGVPGLTDPNPFIFSPLPPCEVLTNGTVNISYSPITDSCGCIAEGAEFTVSTTSNLGELYYDPEQGYSITIPVESDGYLRFQFNADDAGGVEYIWAESDEGSAQGYINIYVIAPLVIDSVSMIEMPGETDADIWAGITGVQTRMTISNLNPFPVNITQMGLTFSEYTDTFNNFMDYEPLVIYDDDTIEREFLVSANGGLPAGYDIYVGGYVEHQCESVGATTTIDNELTWTTYPGRDPSPDDWYPEEVTAGEAFIGCFNFTDDFTLEDNLAGSYVEIDAGNHVWNVPLVTPLIYSGDPSEDYMFESFQISENLYTSIWSATVTLYLHRSLLPGADVINEFLLIDSLNFIYPKPEYTVESLYPGNATVGAEIPFICDITNDGPMDYTISADSTEIKFFPNDTLNSYATLSSTTNEVLEPGIPVTLIFEDYYFDPGLWQSPDDYYYPMIVLNGTDQLGFSYRDTIKFGEQPYPLHVFELYLTADAFSPVDYVFGGTNDIEISLTNPDTVSLDLLAEGGTQLVIGEISYNLLSEVHFDPLQTIVLSSANTTPDFDQLQTTALEYGPVIPVLIVNQTDEFENTCTYQLPMPDTLMVYEFEPLEAAGWELVYPAGNNVSTIANECVIIEQYLTNPDFNTWIRLNAAELFITDQSNLITDTTMLTGLPIVIAPGDRDTVSWQFNLEDSLSGSFTLDSSRYYYSDSLYGVLTDSCVFLTPSEDFQLHTPPDITVSITPDSAINMIRDYSGEIGLTFLFENAGGTGIDMIIPDNDLMVRICDSDSTLIDTSFYSIDCSLGYIPGNGDTSFSGSIIFNLDDNIANGDLRITTDNLQGRNEFNDTSYVWLAGMDSSITLYEPSVFTCSGLYCDTLETIDLYQGELCTLYLDLTRGYNPGHGPVTIDSIGITFRDDGGSPVDCYFNSWVIYPDSGTIFNYSTEAITCTLKIAAGFHPGIVGEIQLGYWLEYSEIYLSTPQTDIISDSLDNIFLTVEDAPFVEIGQMDFYYDEALTSKAASLTRTAGQTEDWWAAVDFTNANEYNGIFRYDLAMIEVYDSSSAVVEDYIFSGQTLISPADSLLVPGDSGRLSFKVDNTGEAVGAMWLYPRIFGTDTSTGFEYEFHPANGKIFHVVSGLDLRVESMGITAIQDTSENEWYNPIQTGCIPAGSRIELTYRIDNEGEAGMEIRDSVTDEWYVPDSNTVYVEYSYEDAAIIERFGGEEMVLVPVGSDFSDCFELKGPGEGKITVSVRNDQVRDENSHENPGESIFGSTEFDISAKETLEINVEDVRLYMDSTITNRAVLEIPVYNPCSLPCIVHSNCDIPQLEGYYADGSGSKDFYADPDYIVSMNPGEATIDGMDENTLTWYFDLIVNKSNYEFSELQVILSGDIPFPVTNLNGSCCNFEPLYYSDDFGIEIAPPYIRNFFLYKLIGDSGNAGVIRTLAAVFSEEINFLADSTHPDSIFDAIPEGFFDDSASCDSSHYDTLFIFTRIADSLFTDPGEYFELEPAVKLQLKPGASAGSISDTCGNHAVGRGYYGFSDSYLSPLPLDVEKPSIDFIESTLTAFKEVSLYFRVFDQPDYYASGIDSFWCKLVNITRDAGDTITNPPIDYDIIGSHGPNLKVTALNCSANDNLYYRLWVRDKAYNTQIKENTIVCGSDSDRKPMAYPSPWNESKPLFLQYYLGKNQLEAEIYIYNNNGDLAVKLSSDWDKSVIIGPVEKTAKGFHRYELKTGQIKQLPTGVYVLVLKLSGSKKIALPLNILH